MQTRAVFRKLWRNVAMMSLVPASTLYLYSANAAPTKQSRQDSVVKIAPRYTQGSTVKRYVDTVANGTDYLRLSMSDLRTAYDNFESGTIDKAEFLARATYAEKGLLLYANSIRNIYQLPASCQQTHQAIARLASRMVEANQQVLYHLENQNTIRNSTTMMENIQILKRIVELVEKTGK